MSLADDIATVRDGLCTMPSYELHLLAMEALDRIETAVTYSEQECERLKRAGQEAIARFGVTSRDGPDPYRFEVYRDWRGEFRWRIMSDEGHVFAESRDGFPSEESAKLVIQGLRQRIEAAVTGDDEK